MIKRLQLFFHALLQELYKITSNYVFFLSIIGVVLLLLSGTVLTEALTSKTYNLYQILFMEKTERIKLLNMYDVTYESIFLRGTDGYLWMFLPVFTSAPFVLPMCAAKKNNNIRFEIFRSGKLEYVMAKCLSAMLCGGLITCLGYAIFTIIIKCLLPEVVPLNINLDIDLYFMLPQPLNFTMYSKRFFELFFYGMTSTCITFTLSGFIRNKYLVLCIPFMLNYFLKKQLSRGKYMENELALISNPSTPSNLFTIYDDKKVEIILFWCGLFIFGILLYRIALGKRCDCGE